MKWTWIKTNSEIITVRLIAYFSHSPSYSQGCDLLNNVGALAVYVSGWSECEASGAPIIHVYCGISSN